MRHLVARGVRQFVDIGSGVPTMGNVHQIAHEGLPEDIAAQLHAIIQMYDDVSKHVLRSKAEFGALFGDFALLEPGVTWTASWHPEDSGPDTPVIDLADPGESVMPAGVGHKP